ncbi:MAG: hypothetical protein AAF653_04525, partial [Chloroflexota bacterium]
DSRSFTWYAETGETKIQNMEGTPIRDIVYASDTVIGALVVGQTLRVYHVKDPAVTEAMFEEFGNIPMLGDMPVELPNPAGVRYTSVAFLPGVAEVGETDEGRPIYEYTLLTGDEAGNLIRWTVRRDAIFEAVADLPEDVLAYNAAMLSYQDDDPNNDIELTGELQNVLNDFMAYRYLSVAPPDKQADVANHNDRAIVAMAINDTGGEVVTVGEDGEVVVWDAETLEKLRIFENQGDNALGQIHDVAFSPGSDLLALATEEIDVLIINIETGETFAELDTGGGDPLALDFTPAGDLVVGADDGRIYVWYLSGEITEARQPSDV